LPDPATVVLKESDIQDCPFSAAERLIKKLPTATLREPAAGHFEPYHREGEILDELLSRQGPKR